MMRTSTFALTAALLVCTSTFSASETIEIPYRPYSASATMGPQAQAYADRVQAITKTALGEAEQVIFVSNNVPIPDGFSTVLSAVEAGSANKGLDAAYISGGDLNKVWGFIYNSGVPFGPTFDEFVGFLLGKAVNGPDGKQTGLELMQSLLAKRGKTLIALPIVASSEQSSGFFPQPIGPAAGRFGIGLAGLCQQQWTIRYLPPAENILGIACDELVSSGVIREKKLKFKAALAGNGSLLGALKSKEINGCEFATPLDDLSQLFNPPDFPNDNPGTVGARFMHAPGWQQQFLITYMIINKGVWDKLSPVQQALVQSVARDHLISSYGENMRQQGGALAAILAANRNDLNPQNDIVLARWPKPALERLRNATIEFLNARASDSNLSATDREDYTEVLEALRRYVQSNELYWREREVAPSMRFERWINEDGERW
jgi:hypothetical protein